MEKPILAAMLSCSGLELTDEEKKYFSQSNPLGVSLFNRNIKNDEQLKKLIKEIKEVIGREDVLIAVDEEGGRVTRLVAAGHPQYASGEVLGAAPVEYSRYHAELIAEDLYALGINVNYAPVVDKKTTPQNKVLEGRCFSDKPEEIVSRAQIMAQTYIDKAICPCIKHIPGHFSSEDDPHLSIPHTRLPVEKIKKEIAYLQNLSRFPLAMTAHIVLDSIDGEYPATQSQKVISEVIRGYLGFDNFLLSDATDMRALKGSISERIVWSLDAGVDAVCCCSGRIEDTAAVCHEQRFLTEKSQIRFAKIKKVIHNTPKRTNKEEVEKLYDTAFKDKRYIKYSYDATEVLHQMLKKGAN